MENKDVHFLHRRSGGRASSRLIDCVALKEASFIRTIIVCLLQQENLPLNVQLLSSGWILVNYLFFLGFCRPVSPREQLK